MQARPAQFLIPPDATRDDLPRWLAGFAERRENRGALTHWETLPARPARHGELLPPLPEPLQQALAARGITQLYTHQVRSIEALRAARDTVVVTGTASGKSLCFHVPALERILEEPQATALYLFPTKALAQDQLKSLTRLAAGSLELTTRLHAGVYDGDTAASTRRKLREEANVILSNPDMLHAGILPQHAKWARFLANLRYVVIDEMHAYRGIFGSHVANVLRRLERLVRHYGGEFRYVLCSATIRNPGELAAALIGRPVTVVDDDGAPRGEKHFVFWNPPYRDEARIERRSSNVEGCQLFAGLIEHGAQVIAFTKSRVSAELVYRYAREQLERSQRGHLPDLHERIRPYRGGYLPQERRAIEQALFSGELRGVVSTNALELGIDVGGLDAAILIGAAPTLASIWQQAGRAGRSGAPSIVVLVAYNDTVDQYLMRQPQWFFGRSPESACVDPHNPYILAQQLACAAYELPLSPADESAFGPQTREVLAALEEAGETRVIDDLAYWARTDFPGSKVSLRNMGDDTYTIQDASQSHQVIGTVDAISAMELVYPEAIYLHDGVSHWVRALDLEQNSSVLGYDSHVRGTSKWEDLADPRLKGKVGVPTAQFAGGRWLIMAALANGGNENNLEPGMAFLKRVKPNVLSFYSTDGESVKVVQSGEVAVAGLGILSDFAKLLGPGSPYRFVIPEGSPVLTSVVSVGMANPKNAALSLKFLEHIAQPEAQAAYCAVINCTPVNPKASPPDAIKDFRPAPERIYAADFAVINKKLPEWDEWYKKEIQAR